MVVGLVNNKNFMEELYDTKRVNQIESNFDSSNSRIVLPEEIEMDYNIDVHTLLKHLY